MRRKDGTCSACSTPHNRNSALCGKCAYAKEKARAAGTRPSRTSQALTREMKKALFLQTLLNNGGHVQQACKAAHCTRTAVGQWRDDDPDFAASWESIQEANVERLEAEVDRRALGYEEEIVYKGEKTGETIQRYSDVLLMFRLKALRPQLYRDGPRAGASGSELSAEELDAALTRMMARRAKALAPDDVDRTKEEVLQ